LHICPPEPYSPEDPLTKDTLNWIFLISSLNFSFWSEKEGQHDRYGVEWRADWKSEKSVVWTGYWSLVAALNRGIIGCVRISSTAKSWSYSPGRRHSDHRSSFLFVRAALPRFYYSARLSCSCAVNRDYSSSQGTHSYHA
jgi:hypothetical protein